MSQVTIKLSGGTYAINSFPEILIIFFKNPYSNFQSCVVIFESHDDAILDVDFSIQSCGVGCEGCIVNLRCTMTPS
jgi:hypothetical protein